MEYQIYGRFYWKIYGNFDTCANSVYQALSSSSSKKGLGMRLNFTKITKFPNSIIINHSCTHRSENSTFTSKEGIFAMSGAERPYMYSTKAELKRESVLLQRHRPGGTRRAGNDTTIPYTASDYGEDRESTALASRDTSTFGPSFSYHQMGNQASSSPRSHPTSSYSERSSNTPHSRAAAGSYGMSYSSSQQQRRQHYSPVGYSHRYENQTTQSSQRREQGTLQSVREVFVLYSVQELVCLNSICSPGIFCHSRVRFPPSLTRLLLFQITNRMN